MHSHRCGIDADSLFDFVGRFTRREFSLVSLFCKSARADRVWTTPDDDDTTCVVSKNISFSSRVVVREHV